MKTLKAKWTGIRPLIMHNGLMADATLPIVKRIKELSKKGSKITDAEIEERNRLEWEAGLYWSDELGPVITSNNIERCIQLGARKSKAGKDVAAAVFCSESEIRLNYDGPRTKDALYQSGRFTLRQGVVVQQSRIMRLRPMFPTGWSLEFTLEYDETVIANAGVLTKAMTDAGALIGLGDWRPKFGRFLVE